MNNYELYLKEKPSRLFFKTAVPGGISMLASSLYTVFDAFFVGKLLGTSAFAALGLGLPLVIINFALADLIGVGSSVPISIFLGQRDEEEANNYFTCASIMIFITGLITGIIIYLAAPWFMRLMGADGELSELGVKYVRTYALFSPLITMMFAMDNFLRICGKIKTSMILNVSLSVGTVFLELLFIGVMNLGIEGSALGDSVAMLLCVAAGMAFFASGKLQLKFVKPRFDFAMIGKIYKNGSSTFLSNIAGRAFSIVMNMMLMRFGGESAVAVYGIAITVCGIIDQILYGVVDSLQPAIGYNYGAKEYSRVKSIEKCVLIAGAVVSLTTGAVIFAVPKTAAILFLKDISLLPMTAYVMRITSFTYIFRWFIQAVQGLFMAIEYPKEALTISISGVTIFPLVLLAAMYPLKLNGLWLNMPLSAFLTAALSAILLIRLIRTRGRV